VSVSYSVPNSVCPISVTKSIAVNASYHDSVQAITCFGVCYTFGSQLLSLPGTYVELFQTVKGCDSMVTLTLAFDSIDVSVVQTGNQLSANQIGANYQWIDCDNGNNILVGETGQVFSPTVAGQYAVVVSRNGCSDTSACYSITDLDANPLLPGRFGVSIYPNPAAGRVTVSTGSVVLSDIILRDVMGRTLQQWKPVNGTTLISVDDYPAGMYVIEVSSGGHRYAHRLAVVR
jgi:hypothetical protein